MPGHTYLVTMVTANRSPTFSDFLCGRVVVKAMHREAIVTCATTLAFVVMPDHVHWLLGLKGSAQLSEVVRRLKATVSIMLARDTPIWQRGFHDHALRANEAVVTVARYIIANPLRAGLVARIGDYSLWDAVWIEGEDVW